MADFQESRCCSLFHSEMTDMLALISSSPPVVGPETVLTDVEKSRRRNQRHLGKKL